MNQMDVSVAEIFSYSVMYGKQYCNPP